LGFIEYDAFGPVIQVSGALLDAEYLDIEGIGRHCDDRSCFSGAVGDVRLLYNVEVGLFNSSGGRSE